jgi:hypothetical protein
MSLPLMLLWWWWKTKFHCSMLGDHGFNTKSSFRDFELSCSPRVGAQGWPQGKTQS